MSHIAIQETTAFVGVVLFLSALWCAVYAAHMAWLDHKHDSRPHEVLHRYEGRPRAGWYFAEFATRKEAQAYLWELADTPGVTEAHIIPTITCS